MSFNKKNLNSSSTPTPFFVFDAKKIQENYRIYTELFQPDTEICYAMKANAQIETLNTLFESGASFEVASKYELDLLKAISVPPERIVYGTAVKPIDHIQAFVQYGVKRYAFDSKSELLKLAEHAPGSQVILRVLVDDKSDSVFDLSAKFGAQPSDTSFLMQLAKEYGLIPYGLSFNVGSQARNKDAWARGIHDISIILTTLQKQGIRLAAIDIGGGFPFIYQSDESYPTIAIIASSVQDALKALPYNLHCILEPGRGLVADAYALVVSVFGKNERAGIPWLYVDAGTYNGLLEALASQGNTRYKIGAMSSETKAGEMSTYIVSGPTGDSLDVIAKNVLLPSGINIGDRLIIYDVGAYSFTLATPFNGFPLPQTIDSKTISE